MASASVLAVPLSGTWEYDVTRSVAQNLIKPHSLCTHPESLRWENARSFNLSRWKSQIHPEDISKIDCAFQKCSSVENVVVEYRMHSSEANSDEQIEWGWVRDHFQVIQVDAQTGRGLKLLINRTNITLEKSFQQKLQWSELRFRMLLSLAPLGVFHTNMDGDLLSHNQRWAEFIESKLFGENQSPLNSKWYDVVDPSYRDETAQKWQKFAKEGIVDVVQDLNQLNDSSSFSCEEHSQFDEVVAIIKHESNSSKEEEERTVRIKIFPVPCESLQAQKHMLGLALDITAETQVQHSRDSVQAISDFVSHISHEMRTPLHGILGYAELLKIEKNIVPQHRAHLRTIWECGTGLLELINMMLEYGKIQSGKLEIANEPFEIKDCVDYVTKVILVKSKPKNLTIRSNIASNVPHVIIGDSSRLKQILLNLLSNAVKFTQFGSVTLDVSVLNPADANDCSEDSDVELLFTITDTGIGIQPEIINVLFQPFTQASAFIYRQFGGTGLGLSISKSLVERMGGKIWIQESVLDKGSVFCFTIKSCSCSEEVFQHSYPTNSILEKLRTSAIAPSPVSSPVPVDASFGRKYPLKILVVDDNQVNQRLCVDMLKRLGFSNIHVVSNGRDALDEVSSVYSSDESSQDARVKRRKIGGVSVASGLLLPVENARPYEVIFMDVLMPIMDGFEATRKIRALPPQECPVQPTIIAFTAGAQRSELDKCIACGMDDCLTKPVLFSQLTSMMEKIFERRSSQQL